MDRFYASWKDGKRAKAKNLERLKSFVKFCINREWIAKDVTRDLKAPEGSSIPANKTPFTDQELERIYAACDRIPPQGVSKWRLTQPCPLDGKDPRSRESITSRDVPDNLVVAAGKALLRHGDSHAEHPGSNLTHHIESGKQRIAIQAGAVASGAV
jgi:hypothetical protein